MTATAAILGGLGLTATTGADDHRRSFVAEQDGECLPVVPLEGDEPVEAFYDWGRDVLSWSSEGTRELQRSETSLLFLYRGPLGLSLVVVHDRADDGTPGGVASFTFEGVPEDAEWAVKDDLYEKSSNVDTWEINGTVLEANETTVTDDIPDIDDNETVAERNDTAEVGDVPELDNNETVAERNDSAETDDVPELDNNETVAERNDTAEVGDGEDLEYDERTDEIDWFWTTGRTDGGALRGLGMDGLEMEIDAAFDEEAELDAGAYERETTDWTLLSGDREDPDRTELDPESTLTLRTGSCETDDDDEESASEDAETESSSDSAESSAEAEADAESSAEAEADAEADAEGEADTETEAEVEVDAAETD